MDSPEGERDGNDTSVQPKRHSLIIKGVGSLVKDRLKLPIVLEVKNRFVQLSDKELELLSPSPPTKPLRTSNLLSESLAIGAAQKKLNPRTEKDAPPATPRKKLQQARSRT